ncbi:MAG: hypothetical protein RRY79_05030 [Clostridia bacterium]
MTDLGILFPLVNTADLGGVRPLKWCIGTFLHAQEYARFAGESRTVNKLLETFGAPEATLALLYGAAKAYDPSYTFDAFLDECDIVNYSHYIKVVYEGLISCLPVPDAAPATGGEAEDYPEVGKAAQDERETDWRGLLVAAMQQGLSYSDFLNTTPRAILALAGNKDEGGSGDWL